MSKIMTGEELSSWREDAKRGDWLDPEAMEIIIENLQATKPTACSRRCWTGRTGFRNDEPEGSQTGTNEASERGADNAQ